MKSKISKKTYMAIYRLLDKVSPIDKDCGTLCDAACCNCGGDSEDSDGLDFDLGIYLLPGEEKNFTMKEDWLKWNVEYAEDYDFPDSWFGKIYFVRCKTPPFCTREIRPLQCRFFPLAPHISNDGVLHLIISPVDLPYICPLIKEHIKLEDEFIKANFTVWKRLIKDPLIYDLVKMDSSSRHLISLTYII
ncbi:MAG: hypothetical protein JJE49_03525 [Peptostreptococcaceae bacterium]|nr:hypothetical protein [Peptostreptococcaceae bacterium]